MGRGCWEGQGPGASLASNPVTGDLSSITDADGPMVLGGRLRLLQRCQTRRISAEASRSRAWLWRGVPLRDLHCGRSAAPL